MTTADLQSRYLKAFSLKGQGIPVSEACSLAGVSRGRFYVWEARYREKGADAFVVAKPTGRPPKFNLSDEEKNVLRLARLTKGSVDGAIDEVLREPYLRNQLSGITVEALSELQTRNVRRRTAYPPALQAAMHVGEDLKAEFRGKKHAQNYALVVRRNMLWRAEDGSEHMLEPGDLRESDDMSVNSPCTYFDEDSKEETLGRQSLISLDVCANFFLGGGLVGRKKDAYRVEDIAEHMLAICDAWGLPKFWRLERGAWENNFINGITLDGVGHGWDGKVWGSLDELFRVQRAWTSGQKGTIEKAFDGLQRIMDHKPGVLCIGRSRGEFEEATKQFLRARQIKDPEERARALAKFWTMEECMEAMTAAMERYNAKPHQRHAFGKDMQVPEELWAERGPKRELPASKRWLFMPLKKQATVNKGSINTSAGKHYDKPFNWQVNGVAGDLYLDHGHRVLIAFHPGRPELGCHVFNADMGTKNRSRYGFGELICIAQNIADAPQIDLSGGFSEQKKQAAAAVRHDFQAVKAAGQDKRFVRNIQRNGRGDQDINLTEDEAGAVQIHDAAGKIKPFRPAAAEAPPAPRVAPNMDEVLSNLA